VTPRTSRTGGTRCDRRRWRTRRDLALGEREPGQPVVVGAGHAAVAEQLDRHVADRLAGEHVGGPDQHLAAVVHCGDRQRRRLHPRDRRAVLPVQLVVLAVRLDRLDAHDELGPGGERGRQVDRGLDEPVVGGVDLDHLVEHERPVGQLSGRCRSTMPRGTRGTPARRSG
jgi:hypothetical protein